MRRVLRAARPLAAALLSSPGQSSRRASICLLQPFVQPRCWPGKAWFRGFAAAADDGDAKARREVACLIAESLLAQARREPSISATTSASFQQVFGDFTSVVDAQASADFLPMDFRVLNTLVRTDLGPSIVLASQFVIPSSESSLCIFVYEVLESFARVGDRRDSIQVKVASFSAEEACVVDGPVLPVQQSETVLTAEGFVRSTLAQGRVQFIVYDANTSLARLVVAVKRKDKLQDEGSMLQLMAETIVVALKDAQALGNHAVVWGALTDVFRWHFIKVTASADASKRGGFAVTVERFIKSSTLFHVGTGRFSETGSATLSTLWNIIFPGKVGMTSKELEDVLHREDALREREVALGADALFGRAALVQNLRAAERRVQELEDELSRK